MLIKTRGIVFKQMKYSETSLIVDIYTEEKGLRKYLISGVRSKKAKVKSNVLQVMSLVEMVAYHREDKDLTRIKEIKPAVVYQSIPFDIKKGAIGLFVAEGARKTIRESETNPGLFDFLFQFFQYLDETEQGVANLHLYFLLNLSLHLGFIPGGECDSEYPFFDMQEGVFVKAVPNHNYYMEEEQSAQLYQLLQGAIGYCHTIPLRRAERKALLNQLLDYYRLHLESFPTINAHLILEEVLEG